MDIKEYKVVPVGKKLFCKDCIEAEMVRSNTVFMTSPPQYKYECVHCDYTLTTQEVYPRVDFEWLDAD